MTLTRKPIELERVGLARPLGRTNIAVDVDALRRHARTLAIPTEGEME
ncbi:MAG TPA: hypothetical protein VFU81_10120 [Thermomicrobiales bacterium]|nr:hypothetical protein [Thermomicrobiales bacterium]